MKENHPENDVRSVASGVRLRVLLPLSAAMILLVLTFVSIFIREAKKRQAEDIARTAVEVEDMFKMQSAEGVNVMRSIMELVIGDRRLEAALQARDRKTLFDLSKPILDEIRERNRISHLYYILPDRTMLLRVHHPDEHGDRIDRFVLQEAQRTGKPFWGNEQGPFGSFTLRVTYPWYSNGEIIGYLELGIEFEDIMQTVNKLLDAEVFVAIDKKFLDSVKWESMRKRLGGQVNWDEFPTVIVISRTRPEIPAPIAAYFAGLEEKHIRRTFETAWDKHVSQTIVTPFTDLRGRELGELVVLRNITAAASGRRQAVLWVATFGAVISGILMAFFFFLLGRVQHDVAERTARLTEAQRVLTIEKFERLRAEKDLALQQERTELVRRLNAELEQKVEERTRQLMDAQEELVRKEKLAILGQLSGSVGHELRNPLGVMSNAVYFLKMVLAEADENVREYLDIIKKEIDNSARIITDLLDFARTKDPQVQVVTVRALIDDNLGKCTIPENIELRDELPETLPPLKIDPMQMGQVLQNLITNGVQAMPAGGVLTLRGGRDSEETVRLEVADTGEGISPANMKKLFQPLFTTKPKGIGLGLVVCRNLAEANGGRIEVSSEPGLGTTFTVTLPVERGET